MTSSKNQSKFFSTIQVQQAGDHQDVIEKALDVLDRIESFRMDQATRDRLLDLTKIESLSTIYEPKVEQDYKDDQELLEFVSIMKKRQMNHQGCFYGPEEIATPLPPRKF